MVLLKYNLLNIILINFKCAIYWILTNVLSFVNASALKIKNVFIILKILLCPFVANPFPSHLVPANHCFYFCHFNFAFSKISYKWNLILSNFGIFFSVSIVHLSIFYVYQKFFVFFFCWILFHDMTIPWFVY